MGHSTRRSMSARAMDADAVAIDEQREMANGNNLRGRKVEASVVGQL